MTVQIESDRRRGSFADGQARFDAGSGPRGRFSTGQERPRGGGRDRPGVVDRDHTRSVTGRNDAGAGPA
jgi:hypothetical protein